MFIRKYGLFSCIFFVCFVIGGIVGGLVIARKGLKRSIWGMALRFLAITEVLVRFGSYAYCSLISAFGSISNMQMNWLL